MAYIGNFPIVGTISGDNIQDGSIQTADLANSAVTAAKMGSGAATGNSGYTPVNKVGDTMTGDLIVNTSIGMGDRVIYDGVSSGAVKHFAMPKTTSRLSWGTPADNNYRLNVSGGELKI